MNAFGNGNAGQIRIGCWQVCLGIGGIGPCLDAWAPALCRLGCVPGAALLAPVSCLGCCGDCGTVETTLVSPKLHCLVAIIALPLQFVFVVLLSPIISRGAGQAAQSRLSMELRALLIGFLNVG